MSIRHLEDVTAEAVVAAEEEVVGVVEAGEEEESLETKTAKDCAIIRDSC